MKQLDRRLLDLIYPDGAVCLGCGRLTHGQRLCGECAALLAQLRLPAGDIPKELPPMPGNVSIRTVWYHEEIAQRLILRLKDDCVDAAAEVLADGLADTARTFDLPDSTVVTWVPMPDKRLKERGIDHARCLAEATAKRLGLRCEPLLVRVGKQHTQRGLNREERLKNLSGAFAARGDVPRSILLIDDVLTTGATAKACCDCLAGADHVFVLTATMSRK